MIHSIINKLFVNISGNISLKTKKEMRNYYEIYIIKNAFSLLLLYLMRWSFNEPNIILLLWDICKMYLMIYDVYFDAKLDV